jgi:TonB family protein
MLAILNGLQFEEESMFKGKHMTLKWTYLYLIITALLFSTNANSEETLNTQFKAAYSLYQDAEKNDDLDAQYEYAKEAYELGKQLYGDTDINTANLALILAQQHFNKNQEKEATPVLLKTLNIFKSEYGDDAIELAEIYILLGRSLPYNESTQATGYYQDALNIAEENEEEHPYFNAQIQLDAGIELLRLGSRKSKAILTAQKFFTENLLKNDKRVVRANFFAGKYHLARKKYRKAVDDFQANFPVFESLGGATHPLELSTRAFMIHALEKSNKSDEATKHCIAIGSMKPWDDSQEQMPLFRTNPKYPIDYAKKGKSGWVQVGFTVSDIGTVKEAKILDSQGGRKFEKSSLAALEKWRYAPKFKDGKPTEAYATVQLDFKVD